MKIKFIGTHQSYHKCACVYYVEVIRGSFTYSLRFTDTHRHFYNIDRCGGVFVKRNGANNWNLKTRNRRLSPVKISVVNSARLWLFKRMEAVRVVKRYRFDYRRLRDMRWEDLMRRRLSGFTSERWAAQRIARDRLDKMIEYVTRPDSEYTQKLMARQLRGVQ